MSTASCSQVACYEPKTFRQCQPDGRGGWTWNLHGVRRVLYHLPEILDAPNVFLVEGEKDIETLQLMGLCDETIQQDRSINAINYNVYLRCPRARGCHTPKAQLSYARKRR
jgi:hypothetical protein